MCRACGCARAYVRAPLGLAVPSSCAVSIDVEKKLYEAARDHGITSITISQRLALEEFHTQELQLGDSVGDDGWTLRDILMSSSSAGGGGGAAK